MTTDPGADKAVQALAELLDRAVSALMECDRDGDYPLMAELEAAAAALTHRQQGVVEQPWRETSEDEVICPNCTHQFRAIPPNVQRLMLDAGFEPPFTAPPAQPQSEPSYEQINTERENWKRWCEEAEIRCRASVVEWAVFRWREEVANRPLVNKNRRTLDDTWRQVIRFGGGDPDALIGPPHDALLAAQPPELASQQEAQEAQEAAEYGSTDFGYTFAGIEVSDGAKRLISMLVRAFGTDHPAVDDLTALLFAASPPRAVEPMPALTDEQIASVIEKHAGSAEWSDDEFASASALIRAYEAARGIGKQGQG